MQNQNPIILIQFLNHGTLDVTTTEIRDIYQHFQQFENTVSVDAYHMFHITKKGDINRIEAGVD